MTLPYERTNAIKSARIFLQDLLIPAKTPRVPRKIRMEARWVLKHFPSNYEIEECGEYWDKREIAMQGKKRTITCSVFSSRPYVPRWPILPVGLRKKSR